MEYLARAGCPSKNQKERLVMTTITLVKPTASASLYGSQGNRLGSELFVEIIKEIEKVGAQKTDPLVRARLLAKIVEMLGHYCDIGYLGVNTVAQEFYHRFTQIMGRELEKSKIPALMADADIRQNTRIIPLYAPWQNSVLNEHKGGEQDQQLRLFIEHFLFLSEEGKFVIFSATHPIKGHTIEYPSRVVVRFLSTEELGQMLSSSHLLLFDYCMRNLIQLCEAAVARANERITQAQSAKGSLVMLAEQMRAGDLSTTILLCGELEHGMNGSGLCREIFAHIASLSGSTPRERLEALQGQCDKLGYNSIHELARLSSEEMIEIIEDPDKFKRK